MNSEDALAQFLQAVLACGETAANPQSVVDHANAALEAALEPTTSTTIPQPNPHKSN